MDTDTCEYIVSETETDEKSKKKQSIMEWLRTVTQEKPKVRCKTAKRCVICGYCESHCLVHNTIRSHLDWRFKPTLWSQLGKKDAKFEGDLSEMKAKKGKAA